MSIWFTSDLHFNHNRDFVYEPRGFSSVYEMNEALLDNYNSVIKPDDEVYILGDLMLGDDYAIKYIRQLNGKIHVIRGNHDSARRLEMYKDSHNIIDIQNSDYFNYGGYRFYLSHYPTLCSYISGKPLKNNLINICGHTHTKDKFADFINNFIYHVEVDAHNCFPVNLDTILEDIKEEYSHHV